MKTKLVLNEPLNYSTYRELVFKLAESGSTTGEANPERIEATKINAQRIKRIDKTYTPSQSIVSGLNKITRPLKWIVLTESWCGDGAQCVPIIAKIAEASPNIDLKIILRDKNPEIMDMYLTNNSRSVPKLICFDAGTDEELGTWGPRPSKIKQMVAEYKLQNPEVSHDEFVKNVHLWYAKDKGESLQNDLENLITQW